MSLAEAISATSSIVVGFAAVAALILAWFQVRVSREISAISAYEDYHKLSLQYPEFGLGADHEKLSELDKRRYLFFVLYALMVGERIFLMSRAGREWTDAIESDVRLHKKFMLSDEFSTYRAQDWAINPIIERVLAE